MSRNSLLASTVTALFGLAACSTGSNDSGGFTFGTTLTTSGDGDGDGNGDGDGETGSTTNDTDVGECGDGVIDPGEDCDFGDGNSDTGQCTTNCRIADCGDGLVLDGLEECDDGNPDNSDGCVMGCKLAVCGELGLRQAASIVRLLQARRYILAVGPPRSLTAPVNPGTFLRSATSFKIDSSLRFCMMRPSCSVIEQKEQPPKQPRMMVTLKRIIS
jgi:cysteine-rich repeat protein